MNKADQPVTDDHGMPDVAYIADGKYGLIAYKRGSPLSSGGTFYARERYLRAEPVEALLKQARDVLKRLRGSATTWDHVNANHTIRDINNFLNPSNPTGGNR